MYQFSDSDSVDSDEGIRYKTESIRNKQAAIKSREKDRGRETHRDRRRSRSRSRSRHRSERSKSKKQKTYSPEDKSSRKSSRYGHRDRERSNDKRRRKGETSNNEKEFPSKPRDEKSNKNYSHVIEPSKESSPPKPDLPTIEDKHLELKKITIDLTDDHTDIPSFGPVAPPKPNVDQESSPQENAFGPQLPPHLLKKPSKEDSIIGPVLPSHFITVSSLDDDDIDLDSSRIENNKETCSIGPALPPALMKNNEENVIGPTLPLNLDTSKDEDDKSNDEEVYGPIPVGAEYSKAHIELEERALKIKMDQLESSDSKLPVREEWMLTLPEAKAANFGLGPRQFRSKAGPDLSDRSSWTDTPEDKAKKKKGVVEPVVDLKKEAEQKHIRKRNLEQSKIANEHKKEKDSLLEIHRKKLKQKKSEVGSNERRPFSREIDLQVNRFDEAQKKAVLKKAQLLDTRFSAGESKFL